MLHSIGGRRIGGDAPVFVIAEIGLNHGGSVTRALEMIDAAAWAGASAVKLQTLFADRLVAPSCPAPAHVNASSLREFFAQFELDYDAHHLAAARARRHGLAVMTTPLAENTVPLLELLELDAYKIASGDLTYDGLIRAAAGTRRPLIISTGMSTLAEVARAVAVAQGAGAGDLALLHCVSAYPTPVESQNLRAIATLARTFDLPTGLSDHGQEPSSALAAVALGACVYERHLVLAEHESAIDRAVSSTPSELKALIAAMEQVRLALGDGVKECQPAEAVNVKASRRGLYAARAMRAGERVTSADVTALRPESSMAPAQLRDLVGATLRSDIAAGEPFTPAHLAEECAA